jgi:Coenzyme PQQ synthesis protein D (PqqD)
VQIVPGPLNSLNENQLPDGSRFLVDQKNQTVFALNAVAGAAWDACSQPTTLRDVTRQMQSRLDLQVTEEAAKEAVLQLQQHHLVATSVCEQQTTRREVLAKLGKVALPLVVAMTLAEQRAHALVACSSMPPPTKHLPTLPPKGRIWGLQQRIW